MAKVKIIFEMEEEVRDELMAAICSIRGYQTKVIVDGVEVDNPVTPGEFAKQEFVKHGQNLIAQKRYEDSRKAAEEATKTALETQIMVDGVVDVTVE